MAAVAIAVGVTVGILILVLVGFGIYKLVKSSCAPKQEYAFG